MQYLLVMLLEVVGCLQVVGQEVPPVFEQTVHLIFGSVQVSE